MTLNDSAKSDLLWWKCKVQRSCYSLKALDFQLEIYSDASLTGWGAACGDETARGSWDASERLMHINCLELQAAFFGLKCFVKHLQSIDLLPKIENTTAISYINRMGGVQYVR